MAMHTIKAVIALKSKKILLAVLLSLTLITQPILCSSKASTNITQDDSVRLKDMVITLLMPSIKDAVNHFYEPYLTIKPTVVPYNGAKITEIHGGERILEGINDSRYTVVVEVLPYIGPHDSIGKDRITLSVQPDGIVVEKFEHLESYDLSPNYQSLIKKPLP
jgi:hypothetical protein